MSDINHNLLDEKVAEYKNAIEKYNNISLYQSIEIITSVIVIFLQALTAFQLFKNYKYENVFGIFITIYLSYVLTDFINGIVHMIMDNARNYNSIIGPFIAAFHLHHYKLTYKYTHALQVYFYESGHKFWLIFYLLSLFIAQYYLTLNFYLNTCLVLIGILSSVAEVSHFWCHKVTKNNTVIRFLQDRGILLSMDHHRAHHCNDNTNYAFLNGMADPILNTIARYLCNGYKKHADIHVSTYAKNKI